MDKSRKGFRILTLGIASLMFSSITFGIDIKTSLKTEYSDNITKTENHQVDDFEHSANLFISSEERYGKFDNSLLADFSYKHYQHGTFSNDLETELEWDGVYHILPNFFTWDISDEISEVVISTTQVNTPDNRERRNVFSTGPRFDYKISKLDSLNLSGLYQRTDFQTEGADSDRLRADTSWSHVLSSRSSAGLNYRWSKTEFSRGRNIYNAEATVFTKLSNLQNTLDLEYGLVDVKSKDTHDQQNTDSSIWDAKYTRRVDASSNLTLSFLREVGDTSTSFDALVDGSYIDLTDIDIVRVTEWGIDYTKTFSSRSRASVRLYDDEVVYLETGDVEERAGIDIQLSRPIRPTLTVSFDANYEHSTFKDIDRKDDRYDLTIGLSKSFFKNLSLLLETGIEEQDSNQPSNDYTEWTISAELTYIPAL